MHAGATSIFPGTAATTLQRATAPTGTCVIEALRRQIFNLEEPSRDPGSATECTEVCAFPWSPTYTSPCMRAYRRIIGGSLYPIRWQGQGTNLYELWDSQLLHVTSTRSGRALAHELHTGAPFGTRSRGQRVGLGGG